MEEAGFELHRAGIDQDELEARHAPYRARLDTLPVPERRPLAFTWRFAMIEAPAKVDQLHDVCSAWRPDLLVFESADLAAPIVASSLGLRRVNHSFGRLVPFASYERASVEVAHLWTELGIDPEPFCGAFGGTLVDICPPSFQTHELPPGLPVERLQPLFPSPEGTSQPAWIATLPDRPTVYVTLGTVRNELSLFRTLLDGLAGSDVNVVATIGRRNDPAELAPLPPNAVVERYVPQSFILPHAAVVVAHGGSGSILATFAEGLPTLLVPQGADQFENAGRCGELGAGLVLMPGEVTESAVRDAVRTLLDDPSYRHRAGELAAEIAAMPHPRDVARRLSAATGA